MTDENLPFDVFIEKDGNEFIGTISDVKLVSAGSSISEVVIDLKEQLVEYATLFISDVEYFSKDKERMKHFPNLLRVAINPRIVDSIVYIHPIKHN